MNKWLILVIAGYFLSSLAISAINPIFEAPDENHHYFAAHYVAESIELPVASAHILARQEAAQGPLYYLIASVLISPIDRSAAETPQRLNPLVRLGKIDSVVNHNAFIHTSNEDWPWRGSALAVHVVRFLSVLLGLGSLLCIYASGRLLWPDQFLPAILGAALVAFLPQWAFLHGSVTNDTLIIFLSSLTLLLIIRLWQDKVTSQRVLAVGAVVGLAMLAKTTGIILLAFCTLLVSALCIRNRSWTQLPKYLALLILPALAISFWWFWRNWGLYGDITASSVFVELGGGERRLPLSYILSNLEPLWLSSIAVFGWMNVGAPEWVYQIWLLILAVCVLGFLFAFLLPRVKTKGSGARYGYAPTIQSFMRPNRGLILLLLLWPASVFAVWFQFNLKTSAEQGRLLFPGMLPVALLLGYGLAQWRPAPVPIAILAFTVAASLYCIGYMLPAAYAMPHVIDVSQIPDDALPIDQDMGLGVELVASIIDTASAQPGKPVQVTLYWRKALTVTTPAIISPEILGRGNTPIGTLPDAYHGGGMYPSDLWPSGLVVQDVIRMRIVESAKVPTLGRVFVRLHGQKVFQQVGSVKVTPDRWPARDDTLIAEFGPGIELASATLEKTAVAPGETVRVRLRWQITESIGRDLTTFVHLGPPDQPPLAQADGPPLDGHYPSSLWDKDEVFDDSYTLRIPDALPAGEYPVRLGLYDPNTGERVPVWISGVSEPGAAVKVGSITVMDRMSAF